MSAKNRKALRGGDASGTDAKAGQVEQLLVAVLPKHQQRPTGPPSTEGRGEGLSSPVRSTGSLESLGTRLSDVLPEASTDKIDEYTDELYEENMELKAVGARRLLRLCTEARNLETVVQHSTSLGVLVRELRENAKRNHELAVAISGIFLCFSHFTRFHSTITKHACSDVAMRIIEYENKRHNLLLNELELTRGRMVAKGSHATKEDIAALQKEEHRYQVMSDRQERLLVICTSTLRNLCESLKVERKLVGQHLMRYLIQLLQRNSDELLISVLGLIHKLVAFEVNKDELIQHPDAVVRLAELVEHGHPAVAFLSLRACYNLSFDEDARNLFATQTDLINTLVSSMQRASGSSRAFAIKLLYQLSASKATTELLAAKHPDTVALALQLASRPPDRHQAREIGGLCVNLATEPACALIFVNVDTFPKATMEAIKHRRTTFMKIVQHVASHAEVRAHLLERMRVHPEGASWLKELVKLAISSSDDAGVTVQVLGILSSLECSSPEVAWPELCEAGLLDLLHRLLMVGFSDDDVVLECILLLGVLALDPQMTALLASAKVLADLPSLLTECKDDSEIVVQLLFTLRCLLLQEETSEAVLQDDSLVDTIVELMRTGSSHGSSTGTASAGQHLVRQAAEETLEALIEADRGHGQERWAQRIQTHLFQLHNQEWCRSLAQSQDKRHDRKESDSSPERKGDLLRGLPAPSSHQHWSDVSTLADRSWGSHPPNAKSATTTRARGLRSVNRHARNQY